ncbi:MAG: hypothetical protein ACREMR_10255, partial [Gemmatimonadales bacterium]
MIDALEWLHRLPGRPPLAAPLLVHLAGMLAMGLLARALWNAGPAAVAWAGIAWGLLPNLVVPFANGHDAQMVSASLIPVSLLAAHFVVASERVLAAAWAALGLTATLAVQATVGHPQITAYGAVLLAAFLVVRAWRGRLARLALAAAAAALAAAIGAAAWWPALLYSAHSVRGGASGVSLAEVARFSHSARDLLSIAWPGAMGSDGPTYWGGLRQTDYPQFSGALVCLLAFLRWPRRGEPDRATSALLAAMALGFAALSLGAHLRPLYDAIAKVAPVLPSFRTAVAAMIVTQLSLALLSARGFDRALAPAEATAPPSRWPQPARVALAIGALALLLGGALAYGPLAGLYRDWALHARPGFEAARAASAAHAAGLDLGLRGLLAASLGVCLWIGARRAGPSRLSAAACAAMILLAIDLGSVVQPGLAPATGTPSQLEAPPPTPLARITAAAPRYRALPLERRWFESNDWVSWRARSLAGLHGAVDSRWDQLMGAGALRRVGALRALAIRYLAADSTVAVDTSQVQAVFEDGRRLPVLELRHALPRAYA